MITETKPTNWVMVATTIVSENARTSWGFPASMSTRTENAWDLERIQLVFDWQFAWGETESIHGTKYSEAALDEVRRAR